MSTLDKKPAPKGRFGHAPLECPHCSKICRPVRKTVDHGASYRCYGCTEAANHGRRYSTFRIDGSGDLYY